MDALQARTLIASLRRGEHVTYTDEHGNAFPMTVQPPTGTRWDGETVTVGFGPGRWNCDVTASRLAAGRVGLART